MRSPRLSQWSVLAALAFLPCFAAPSVAHAADDDLVDLALDEGSNAAPSDDAALDEAEGPAVDEDRPAPRPAKKAHAKKSKKGKAVKAAPKKDKKRKDKKGSPKVAQKSKKSKAKAHDGAAGSHGKLAQKATPKKKKKKSVALSKPVRDDQPKAQVTTAEGASGKRLRKKVRRHQKHTEE